MKTCIFLAVLAIPLAAQAGGDYDISANGNTRSGTLGQGQVDEGVVVNIRLVKVEPSNMAQATGTGIGAALGAAAGSQIGHNGGNYAATALAGVLGGVVGNIATDAIANTTAQEVIIRKTNGQVIVITQAESSLGVGQPVYLVDSAGRTRVIPR